MKTIWALVGALTLSAACGTATGEAPSDGSGATADSIDLNIDSTSGYDDNSSPGSQIAVVVDQSQSLVLVIAIKFEKPSGGGTFTPGSDAAFSATDYSVATPSDWELVLAQATDYPLIHAALSDTPGIRTRDAAITAILLEGDLQSPAPSKIYVADAGEVTYYRNDGPNVLEGHLDFKEVSALGDGATLVSGGNSISLDNFYFEYDKTSY